MPEEGLAAQADASPEAVIALYETWVASGSYDRDVEQWGYEAPERCAELVTTALARCPGDVLDAGCGTGKAGLALADVGVTNIVGGDVSPSSADLARERGIYTDVVPLDLNAPLDFADGRFAVTVSVGVFSYVTDTEATLRELLRVVAPGGSVIFTQRTDLWDGRNCDAIVAGLVDDGACAATISDPQPYLPRHPDFRDVIRIRYVTLVRPG